MASGYTLKEKQALQATVTQELGQTFGTLLDRTFYYGDVDLTLIPRKTINEEIKYLEKLTLHFEKSRAEVKVELQATFDEKAFTVLGFVNSIIPYFYKARDGAVRGERKLEYYQYVQASREFWGKIQDTILAESSPEAD